MSPLASRGMREGENSGRFRWRVARSSGPAPPTSFINKSSFLPNKTHAGVILSSDRSFLQYPSYSQRTKFLLRPLTVLHCSGATSLHTWIKALPCHLNTEFRFKVMKNKLLRCRQLYLTDEFWRQSLSDLCATCAQDVCKMCTYVMFDIHEPNAFWKCSTCWILEKSEEPCRFLKKFVHACIVNVHWTLNESESELWMYI